MATLEWSVSHAVFVDEMDDEHAKIVQALCELQTLLAGKASPSDLQRQAETVAARVESHFSHEERLMRAARYSSFGWHKRLHDQARRRVLQLLKHIENGEPDAGPAMVEYLTSWLHDHTRVADMMLGAFLRNHRRGLYKMSFRAGTKPSDACVWVDSRGEKFDPGGSGGSLPR